MKKLLLLFGLIFIIACGNQVNEDIGGDVMELKSVFESNAKIPSKYTCDGDNVNPGLIISDVPENAISLVLIMDDPDIPEEVKKSRGIDVFVHWVLFNIPTSITKIEEGTVSTGILGRNSAGENAYTGPCPPKQYQPSEHRYFFKLYALDVELDLLEGVSKEEVEDVMHGHVIEKIELVGKYERK